MKYKYSSSNSLVFTSAITVDYRDTQTDILETHRHTRATQTDRIARLHMYLERGHRKVILDLLFKGRRSRLSVCY